MPKRELKQLLAPSSFNTPCLSSCYFTSALQYEYDDKSNLQRNQMKQLFSFLSFFFFSAMTNANSRSCEYMRVERVMTGMKGLWSATLLFNQVLTTCLTFYELDLLNDLLFVLLLIKQACAKNEDECWAYFQEVR